MKEAFELFLVIRSPQTEPRKQFCRPLIRHLTFTPRPDEHDTQRALSDTITALITSRTWNMRNANYYQILIRDEIA